MFEFRKLNESTISAVIERLMRYKKKIIFKRKGEKKRDGTEGIEPSAMDSRGIEPRTTPMLREYYTTKPQAPIGC